MLAVKNLSKKYGKFTAVENLSFQVEEGAIFGFIGPNGAGKTTTMKILATLLKPTSGHVWIAGQDLTANPGKIRRLVGYMPDFFGVYDDLKVSEYLAFYAASYGIADKRLKIIDELLELVDLQNKRDSYVDSLSRGMKQRLCLARCLVHDPALLILDEPASGLDPRARVEVREILKELRAMGKTIIVSSHILSELSEVCTHMGIIEAGKMVACGTVDEVLYNGCSEASLEIKVLNQVDKAMELLGRKYESEIKVREKVLELPFSGNDEDMSQLLSYLVAQEIPVVSFSRSQNKLEDIFMQLTEGVVQ